MKRSIIFLMALIVLCAFPVLASTPEQDMVLIVDEGDGEFSGLEQVSDEKLDDVEGEGVFCPKTMTVDKIYVSKTAVLDEILQDALIHLEGNKPLTVGDIIDTVKKIKAILTGDYIDILLDLLDGKYGNIPL
jgi:hypothetical protein